MTLMTYINSVRIGGVEFKETREVELDGSSIIETGVNSAATGYLIERTSDVAGKLFMADGLNFEIGQKLDLYWDVGSRRHVEIVAVTDEHWSFSGGAGDVLPVINSRLSVGTPQEFDMPFVGDEVRAIVAFMRDRGSIVFLDGSGAVMHGVEVDQKGIYLWIIGDTEPNPLDSKVIDRVLVSQSSNRPSLMRLGIGQGDAPPDPRVYKVLAFTNGRMFQFSNGSLLRLGDL